MLYIHHGDQWVAACLPFLRGLVDVADAAHQAGLAGLDDGGGVETQRVAVVAVEGGGEGTATLIAEIAC